MEYVMADIHAQYDMFLDILSQIEFSAQDKLYVLGDLTDWGPDPLAVIRFLMAQTNVQTVLGNHDKMLLDFLKQKLGAKERWLRNGGRAAMEALFRISISERDAIFRWFSSLPLYLIIDNYILVHAGLRRRPFRSLEELMAGQHADDLLFIRQEFFRHPAVPGQVVIFGHTRTSQIVSGQNYCYPIWYDPIHKDKIGIDCGANSPQSGGRLACLCIDNMKEYYSY